MKDCCLGHKEAIIYNPYNKVVQCHVCGHVYLPASNFMYFLNRIFKWWGN